MIQNFLALENGLKFGDIVTDALILRCLVNFSTVGIFDQSKHCTSDNDQYSNISKH